MDQAVRNKLRNVVTQCRKLLEDSVAQTLQGQFGIYASGKKKVHVDDESRMGHLSEEDQAYRRDILDHLGHVEARGFEPRDSLDQLVREIAFTHLNRFCAYKMMEARDVYVGGERFRESVTKGLKSQGFLFYLADHPEDEQRYNSGEQDVAYRHFLDWLGGTLSEEIGVLFNPNDPANRLYPPQRLLDEVIDLLNGEDIKPDETELRETWPDIWSQDETIGWVYQYFTPKELRDKARKESQAPRNSYELAFRNQFFTPRYVVEFLTDNTLGRIWYEMRQGRTKLAEQCQYLVRRPDEVFLAASTCPDHENHEEGSAEAARLLQEGAEDDFPPFDATDEDSIQRMISLAHCVSYGQFQGEDEWAWFGRKQPQIGVAGASLDEHSTGDLLGFLFLTCRNDRHGGEGSVYRERWFVDACNEVRRRAIASRAEDATQEELLKAPQFIPYRPRKDPRELKILDPACGSGHFLLYCFDLLQTIYEEAWNAPDLGEGLRNDFDSLEDLRRAVPGLILARNLHGIDIDLRATQIAALALWLRCQRAFRDMGLGPKRPQITRSNIVCAEPMPGEEGLLDEFLDSLREDLLEQLARTVLDVPKDIPVHTTPEMVDRLGELVRLVRDTLKLAGEAGSLLAVEEHLQEAIREGQHEWEKIQPLFRVSQYRLTALPVESSLHNASGKEVSFWDQSEALVTAALDAFASCTHGEDRFLRTLFLSDAIRGFAFLDVCMQRYDICVTNPPFGLPSISTPTGTGTLLGYATSKNLAWGLVERCAQLVVDNGVIGALVDRTIFQKSSYERFRTETLQEGGLATCADLGVGVLDDADVMTCCFSFHRDATSGPTAFFDVRQAAVALKGETLAEAATGIQRDALRLGVHFRPISDFAHLPFHSIAYWIPQRAISKLFRGRTLGETDARIAGGLQSNDVFRFVRILPEVPYSPIDDAAWVPFYNGGPYSLYWLPISQFVLWKDDGAEIKDKIVRELGDSPSRFVKSERLYFAGGLAGGKRGEYFDVHVLPEGCVFSNEGRVLLRDSIEDNLSLLGYINSHFCQNLVNAFCGQHKGSDYLKRVPFPADWDGDSLLAQQIGIAVGEKRRWCSLDEGTLHFVSPWSPTRRREGDGIRRIADLLGEGLSTSNGLVRETETQVNFRLSTLLSPELLHEMEQSGWTETARPEDRIENISDAISECRTVTGLAESVVQYSVGVAFGRWDVRCCDSSIEGGDPNSLFERLPCGAPALLRPASASDTATTPYPVAIDADGVLVDDVESNDDIERRIREILGVLWGDSCEDVEQEICESVGVRSLRAYFRKSGKGGFWESHVRRYSSSRRKAPIYWLLQSSKKNYALWLYYHRLDRDILFKALVNYVEPKIRLEEARLEALRSEKSGAGKGAKKLDRQIEKQEDFLSELRDFEDKLRRAADLRLDPDLNDGVVLNIAPLHELVPWREAKRYWDDLLDGKYEWSSIGQQLREKGLVK